MTTFNDKEKAAENKYAHDKELEFRIHARRNKLMGLWAGARMNLSGTAAEDYTKGLIAATITTHDDEQILARLKADFSAKGIAISEQDLRTELHRVSQVAKEQVGGE